MPILPITFQKIEVKYIYQLQIKPKIRQMNFKEMNYKQKYPINIDIKFLILVTWVHETIYTQLYGMI